MWSATLAYVLLVERNTLALLALGLLSLSPLACSSDAPPPAVNGSAPVAVAGPTDNDLPCAGPNAVRPPGSSCVAEVRGQLIDSADAPVSSSVTVCGGGVLCVGSAASEGVFRVSVNRFVDLSTFVFWVHGFPAHSDMILPLKRATSSDVLLTAMPRVPRFDNKGDVLPPSSASGGVFRSGPVELTLAEGTSTQVAPAHEASRDFLVGTVPDLAKWDTGIVAMYALGPPGARFSRNVDVALTLPDSARISDGTTLELVVLDDDLLGGRAGTFLSVGTATVTKGVARSIAGEGIDRLTWVGVRVPKGG